MNARTSCVHPDDEKGPISDEVGRPTGAVPLSHPTAADGEDGLSARILRIDSESQWNCRGLANPVAAPAPWEQETRGAASRGDGAKLALHPSSIPPNLDYLLRRPDCIGVKKRECHTDPDFVAQVMNEIVFTYPHLFWNVKHMREPPPHTLRIGMMQSHQQTLTRQRARLSLRPTHQSGQTG